ncbi:hypothetical protein G6F40_013658 [Rhizopus arrhizus]|nr:hypothetical protein G6F40_013658 [Rhizopus arrhizus]
MASISSTSETWPSDCRPAAPRTPRSWRWRPGRTPDRSATSAAARRRVWQGEGIQAKQQRRQRGHLEGQLEPVCLLPAHPADQHAGDDPADTAGYAHQRELLFRRLHVPHRHAVGQCQRRHEQQHVAHHAGGECGEVRRGGRQPQQHRTGQVQDREDALRREVAIGDQPDQEGRDDGPDRLTEEGGRDLARAGLQRALHQVRAQGDEPRSPDEELQKHHRAQARHGVRHGLPSRGGNDSDSQHAMQ